MEWIMVSCTECAREFEPEPEAHRVVPFCGSYCEQSWWMSPTAGREFERLMKGEGR